MRFAGIDIGSRTIELMVVDDAGEIKSSLQADTGFDPIAEAKRLLDYTDYSILDIALHLGFKSQSHFTTTFKKFEGLTPKEYRKTKK